MSARAAWLLLAGLGLSSCYEGWQAPKANGTPPTPTPAPSPQAKTFTYVLFQPISLADDGLASDACFPKTGIRTYKSTEWSLRIDAITAGLAKVADKVSVHPISISAADCAALDTVQTASLAATPWGDDPSPSEVRGSNPLLHLTAAFWEGEPAAVPGPTVTSANWSAWQQLKDGGKPALSRRYFVISNAGDGYFTAWQKALAKDTYQSGTAIDNVDPSDGGIASRQARVDSDTSSLMTWLVEQKP